MASPFGRRNQLFSTLSFFQFLIVMHFHCKKQMPVNHLRADQPPHFHLHAHTPSYPLLSIYPNASFFHPEITACLWQLEMSHRCVSHHSWSLAVHPGTHEHMHCAQSAQFCFLHSAWQRGSMSNICMCVRNCFSIYLALFLQSIIACPLRRRKVQVQNSFELCKHILSPELLKHATSWKINHSDNIWHLQINHKMTFSFIRWSIF